MTILFSILSVVTAAVLFFLTGLYTVWYWYFIPLLLLIPLYWVYFVLFVLFAALVGLFFSKKKPVKKPYSYFYYVTVAVLRQVLLFFRVKIRVNGLEKLPEGECLVVYNHRSFFDPLILLVKLPLRRMAMISKPENEKIPVVGKYMHMSGFLVIDRKSPMKARSTVEKGAEWIRNGIASVVISPEGTRSKTGKLLPFRAAPFSMARRANCSIVVTTLTNTDRVLKNFPFHRTVIELRVVDVVNPTDYEVLTSVETSDHIRAIMLKALGQTDEE